MALYRDTAVAVEAMACARPVIVTSSCGVAGFVRDGENGSVVPPNDPDALRAAIEWFADDRRRVVSCGERARETYDRFDFDEYLRVLTDDITEKADAG